MLHYLRVGLHITIMQSHTHTMQQTRTHKAVTRRIEAIKLLSRRKQSEYRTPLTSTGTRISLILLRFQHTLPSSMSMHQLWDWSVACEMLINLCLLVNQSCTTPATEVRSANLWFILSWSKFFVLNCAWMLSHLHSHTAIVLWPLRILVRRLVWIENSNCNLN